MIKIENVQPKKGESRRRYDLEVVPGESITVIAHNQVRTDTPEHWDAYFPSGWIPAGITQKLIKMDQRKKDILAQMINQGDTEVALDFLEDEGIPREYGVNVKVYVGFYKYEDQITRLTYKVGDVAEYDSYNLHYLGTIKSITNKSVVISKDHHWGGKTARLSLYEFAWRNETGVEKKNESNLNWMD